MCVLSIWAPWSSLHAHPFHPLFPFFLTILAFLMPASVSLPALNTTKHGDGRQAPPSIGVVKDSVPADFPLHTTDCLPFDFSLHEIGTTSCVSSQCKIIGGNPILKASNRRSKTCSVSTRRASELWHACSEVSMGQCRVWSIHKEQKICTWGRLQKPKLQERICEVLGTKGPRPPR